MTHLKITLSHEYIGRVLIYYIILTLFLTNWVTKARNIILTKAQNLRSYCNTPPYFLLYDRLEQKKGTQPASF